MTVPSHATYTNLMQARMWRAAQRVSFGEEEGQDIRLTVLSGLHKGSETYLTGGIGTIGAEPSDDVMLVDDDAVGPQVHLTATSSLLGTILRVSSKRQDLKVEGSPLRDGETWTRLPCTLSFGEIEIELCDPPDAPPGLDLLRGGSVWVLAIAIMAAAYMLAPTRPPLWQVAAPAEPVVMAASEVLPDPVTLVSEKLAAANLADHLTVSHAGNGAVMVSGSLPKTLMRDWRVLRMQHDSEASGVGIMSKVRPMRDLVELPAIAAVRFGADPSLLMGNGETLHPGGKLPDGWVISKIEQDGVMLSRRGERLKVNF